MKIKTRYLARLILSTLVMFVMVASASGQPNSAFPTRIYVDIDASGANDGSTWTDAYEYLQDALDLANFNGSTDYEIWVAEGVYYPDEEYWTLYDFHTNDNTGESFEISHDNVKLYGGFAGGETSLDQRDWEANLTILSGDIDGNDVNIDGNYIAESTADHIGSNAYHVVKFNGYSVEAITGATELDGFIITAGSASGAGTAGYGGGIYCLASSGVCSPTLRELVIQGNYADSGGGVHLDTGDGGESSPTLTEVSFINNLADASGGGIYSHAAYGASAENLPVLVNVKFIGNTANSTGGGIEFTSYLGTAGGTLTNVEFYNNTAHSGGGMYNYGSSGDISVSLNNVTFSGNSAVAGGALYNSLINSGGDTFSIEVNNSILWGNVGTTQDPEIFNYDVVPLIANCDIQDSFDEEDFWVSALGSDLGGNLDVDPQFVNGGAGDLRLLAASPVIDMGDQALLPADVTDLDLDGNYAEDLPFDLAGNPRVENGELDMGAYEFLPSDEENVGFYIPGNYRWYLKTDKSDGWGGVISFGWGGVSELIPVVGDWDGDGDQTAAFYKPSQWRWYLKNDYADGWAGVETFQWGGNAELIPIAGDWDGDGDDTVGFYKPSDAEWYLKDDNTGGWTGFTTVVWGGASGNVPIAGDWDGDGDDTIGFYVPSQNKWWLKNDLADGWAGVTGFNFGSADPMKVVVGDWNGDGIDTVGGYVPSKWSWFLKDDQVDGWSNVTRVRFGVTAGYEVLAGDWQ